jgi:hypothetical protein
MSADRPQTQVVVSPGGTLTYNPSNFTASNGTSVTFVFAQYDVLNCYIHNGACSDGVFKRNITHSVTQTTLENPCVYLAAGNGSSGGFDSGLQSGTQYTITITNDQARKPVTLSFFVFTSNFCATAIFFFCKSTGMCGSGMVG